VSVLSARSRFRRLGCAREIAVDVRWYALSTSAAAGNVGRKRGPLESTAGTAFAGRNRIGLAARLVFFLGVVLTTVVFVLARGSVRDSERSLLRERESQTLGVVATVVQQLEAGSEE